MGRLTSIRFDHVACGVRSIAEVAPLLERELGARAHRGGPGEGFRGAQWEFAGEGRLELIEPDGEPGGFLHRFLAAGGPGIHHVTFKVPDLAAMRERATALGFDVVGYNDESPSWKEMFLHPKQAGGIVVQMAEVDPDAQGGNWLPIEPYTTGEPAHRVALRGLRLLARDEALARRVFLDLLGGGEGAARRPPAAGSSQWTLAWEESPLSIHIVVDPSAEIAGPIGLEFNEVPEGLPARIAELLGSTLLPARQPVSASAT